MQNAVESRISSRDTNVSKLAVNHSGPTIYKQLFFFEESGGDNLLIKRSWQSNKITEEKEKDSKHENYAWTNGILANI